MDWYVKNNEPSPDLHISGDTLEEAVGHDFERLAKQWRVGNVAGYRLSCVWMEYNPDILGGKGGAELHIKAYGSDVLVDYDASKDQERETIIWIYCTPEDLPQRIDFGISASKEEARD